MDTTPRNTAPSPRTKAPRSGHRLVSSRVATLAAGTYTDPGQAGLQLRVLAKAGGFSRSWLLRFKFRGQESRILLGHFPETTLEQARSLAREAREKAAQGIDPRRARARRRPGPSPDTAAAAPVDQHSVEYLVDQFIERHLRPTRKRPEYAERILRRDVLPYWKGRDARTITPAEVLEVLDRKVDSGKRVIANRIAALLTQLFKFGIHRGIVAATPVQLLYRPGGKEKPRERILTDGELKALIADPVAATRYERLSHVILILLLTGQRRGELALARWADVDLAARTWRIPPENSKTSRGHVVPLSPWAVTEFRALKREAERAPWVLPNKDKTGPVEAKLLTRGLAKCLTRMKARGIGEFTLHDLRRTCRTGLARLKIQPHIAERVLNHAQERIPGTYDVHDYMDEKRDALTKWASHLRKLKA